MNQTTKQQNAWNKFLDRNETERNVFRRHCTVSVDTGRYTDDADELISSVRHSIKNAVRMDKKSLSEYKRIITKASKIRMEMREYKTSSLREWDKTRKSSTRSINSLLDTGVSDEDVFDTFSKNSNHAGYIVFSSLSRGAPARIMNKPNMKKIYVFVNERKLSVRSWSPRPKELKSAATYMTIEPASKGRIRIFVNDLEVGYIENDLYNLVRTISYVFD